MWIPCFGFSILIDEDVIKITSVRRGIETLLRTLTWFTPSRSSEDLAWWWRWFSTMVKSDSKISSHLTSRHPLDNGWQPVRYMEEALDCSGCLGEKQDSLFISFHFKTCHLVQIWDEGRDPGCPLQEVTKAASQGLVWPTSSSGALHQVGSSWIWNSHLRCQGSVGGGEDDNCVVKDTPLFPILFVRHPAHFVSHFWYDFAVSATWHLLRWLTILPTASSSAVSMPR